MDNSEKIREYISQNEGTTEYKVAKFMAEHHICARATTHNIVYNNLIPAGKVVDKKTGNSFHKLYINHKNEFNNILREINQVYQIAMRFNNFGDLQTIERLKSSNSIFRLHFRNIVHSGQIIIYTSITQLAHKINNSVKSPDDREILYVHVVNLLEVCSELNIALMPIIVKGLEDTIRHRRGLKMSDERYKRFKKLGDEFTNMIHKQIQV